MSFIPRLVEPDERDQLPLWLRLLLSAAVTGGLGFLLEYIGTEVLHAFSNDNPSTIYVATAVWALAVGPLLVAFRRTAIIVPMAIVGATFALLVLMNHYSPMVWELQ